MNRKPLRSSFEDILSSPSSDDKMDTSSESFQTNQDTPNSTQSESEDREDVLKVHNPVVLRLAESEDDAASKTELSDSLTTKMSKLTVDSPDNRPRNLGISPPKLSSTLTSTTSHPLMILTSPDENFPDLIPKKSQKLDEEKDLSLSSIEDEKATTNGYEFYSPQRNTSKNNLYYSENFVTADSNILTESLNTLATPPDVARVDQRERRKISARYLDNPKEVTPQKGLSIFDDHSSSAMKKYLEKKVSSHSTPKPSLNISEPEEFHSGVADWCDSPSQLRAMPNFDLPIEMSSNIRTQNDLDSPDVVSSSTQEDKSAYQALLDPYTGSVALKPTGRKPPPPRRKVQVPQEEDSCSLDSVSGCSMESEDEPPPLPPVDKHADTHADPHADPHADAHSDDENTKRSKSTLTLSECSDAIPEYSAAEELQDERAWLTVQHGGRQSKCDMKVIEEFKRVVSHGGYDAGGAALIVFSACHLPDTARPDYRYVMDNLFLYVIWSLERLVTEEYVLVYLHGSAGRRRLPSAAWLHECYKLIDRRLRKSLKHLYLVHPTFWLKSFVIITKPFVSSKFFRKLSYVKSLAELYGKVPVEPNAIPEIVKQFDARR